MKILRHLTIYAMNSKFCRDILRVSRRIFNFFIGKYHRENIKQLLEGNVRNNYRGIKKGQVIFTHINPKVEPNFLYLEKMLDCKFSSKESGADAALIWGTGSLLSRYRVAKKAKKEALPLLIGEDGFIRSVGISANAAAGLSCILDHEGVYYDASMGSAIVSYLNSDWTITEGELNAVRELISLIVSNHISKYNFVNPTELCFDPNKEYQSITLVIDQRRDDQSVLGALADVGSFDKMLKDAIRENSNDLILIKVHPDAVIGGCRGYYSAVKKAKNVRIISESINSISLLKAVDKVYTVSSQMGMEALMCNKQVFCYGAPFYSFWGLTTDRGKTVKRFKQRSFEEIFFTAYVKYAYYFNPASDQRGSLKDVVTHLSQARNIINA